MKIGPFTFHQPVILAPMAGVTDRPFRQMCKKLGADIAVTEMVGSKSLQRGCTKTLRRANHRGEVSPISVQIVGADPQMMAAAAQFNADQGAQFIDINMGCPAVKVCNMLSGSALLKEPKLVTQILEAVVKAVSIPVTLKIRTGWSPQNRNGPEIAQIAYNSGIQALSVHGRTRSCFFKGEAEYETIRAIKAAVPIPIIANGDIDTPEKAKAVLTQTGADGVMIGRAAQGRPWIFREIKHYLATNQHLPSISPQEVEQILSEHLENLYEFYGTTTGVMIARKHVSWYVKGHPFAARFREHFNQVTTADEQREAIRTFFSQLAQDGEV